MHHKLTLALACACALLLALFGATTLRAETTPEPDAAARTLDAASNARNDVSFSIIFEQVAP